MSALVMQLDTSDKEKRMKRTLLAAATLIAATALPAMLQKVAAQDVEKGQRSFNKCLPCHAIGPGAENKVGPALNGIDGRHAGAVASFNYSEANKNSGLVWNEATFKDYTARSRGPKWPSPELPIRRRSTICGPISSNSMPTATSRNRLEPAQ
jgi:cytochrome c2